MRSSNKFQSALEVPELPYLESFASRPLILLIALYVSEISDLIPYVTSLSGSHLVVRPSSLLAINQSYQESTIGCNGALSFSRAAIVPLAQSGSSPIADSAFYSNAPTSSLTSSIVLAYDFTFKDAL